MRTRIVATLGPASMNRDVMTDMVRHGVRIFRLNFSHSNAEAFTPVVEMARSIEAELGTPITLMGDLCGPKVRIGEIPGSPMQIAKGQTVNLGLPEVKAHKTCDVFIGLDMAELLVGLEEGMPVSLSDGMLQFKVTGVIEKDRLYEMQALNGGLLTSNKGIAFPGKFHPMPALTEKDKVDLHEGLDIGLDAFALSFVQDRKDIEDIKREIEAHGTWVPVIAKIERQNAVDNIESILEVTDAIMVARGDLGLECPLFKLPVIQKRIIRACRHAQKACIVATQMVLSMVNNPVPTRAEITDVANAMLDGADCVMLSEETAIGKYPTDVVRLINEIGDETEAYYLERIKGPYAPKDEPNLVKHLAYAASLMAQNAGSSALVCHSESGSTARLFSSRRPAQKIYGLTPNPRVVKYLNFFWGMHPRLSDDSILRHMERAESFVQKSKELEKGQSVVITAGQPTPGQQSTGSNQLKIYFK